MVCVSKCIVFYISIFIGNISCQSICILPNCYRCCYYGIIISNSIFCKCSIFIFYCICRNYFLYCIFICMTNVSYIILNSFENHFSHLVWVCLIIIWHWNFANFYCISLFIFTRNRSYFKSISFQTKLFITRMICHMFNCS